MSKQVPYPKNALPHHRRLGNPPTRFRRHRYPTPRAYQGDACQRQRNIGRAHLRIRPIFMGLLLQTSPNGMGRPNGFRARSIPTRRASNNVLLPPIPRQNTQSTPRAHPRLQLPRFQRSSSKPRRRWRKNRRIHQRPQLHQSLDHGSSRDLWLRGLALLPLHSPLPSPINQAPTSTLQQ